MIVFRHGVEESDRGRGRRKFYVFLHGCLPTVFSTAEG